MILSNTDEVCLHLLMCFEPEEWNTPAVHYICTSTLYYFRVRSFIRFSRTEYIVKRFRDQRTNVLCTIVR